MTGEAVRDNRFARYFFRWYSLEVTVGKSRIAITRLGMVMAIVAMTLTSQPAQAQHEEPLPREEQFRYRVGYGLAHLANLGLTLDCGHGGELSARLIAQSTGMTSRIHPFRVRLDSVRPLPGEGPHQAQTWIEEHGELRRYRSSFDQTPQVRTSAEFRGEEWQELVALPAAGHDLLSWVLQLRQDVARSGVQKGARRFPLWDGWKLVWLDVSPGPVVQKQVDGKPVQAQSFRLRRTRLDHEDQGRYAALGPAEELGTLWIEVSERALPVGMAFRAPIGRVRIDLIAYEPRQCGLAGR